MKKDEYYTWENAQKRLAARLKPKTNTTTVKPLLAGLKTKGIRPIAPLRMPEIK